VGGSLVYGVNYCFFRFHCVWVGITCIAYTVFPDLCVYSHCRLGMGQRSILKVWTASMYIDRHLFIAAGTGTLGRARFFLPSDISTATAPTDRRSRLDCSPPRREREILPATHATRAIAPCQGGRKGSDNESRKGH
jgi:hypothetical protein